KKTLRISFNWAVGLFAAFILLCGITHVLDIITVWHPIYYVQGLVKAATGIVSILTAIAIIPLVPRLARMRSPEELEEANHKLSDEVARRSIAETNLRQSVAELKAAMGELESFTYITSHDLQAPLRNIAGFSQLLSSRYRSRLDGDALEFLSYIDQGSRQMQQLIRDLLQLSRVGRSDNNFEVRPLDYSIGRARAALASEIEKSGAEIVHDPLPEILAEHSLLTQLFQNLIGNSIKFQRPGNRPRIQIVCARSGSGWFISLSDNGIGIPANQLDQVFAIFRRLHNADEFEGTGIGLAICRKIVTHHGGEIRAVKREGGAEFHIILPAEPSVARPALDEPVLEPGSAT
ncbi:MAG TPA: ATP-binding protein, partial [Nevskiaceae bacterium]|nr:ATP-binding protein [Nevskiaceae bacterium]